ncbi:MAG: hypothetical protein Fur0043_07720 [Anaerolineales bacterium]
MMPRRHGWLLSWLALLVLALACRPVIAIGWEELIVLVVLIAFLLGPLLWRLYRFLARLQRFKESDRRDK